jgi:TRAP-type C4-dicarboxylate transport system permease small subunit
LENILVIIILTLMITMAFLQVILRNFFSNSIMWGDIFLRHLVLWIGFLGASLATREGKHINIDVLSRLLSPRFKRISGIIVNLFSSVVCFFLMRASIGFIIMEKESGTTLLSGIPTWTAQIIIAIGFGIMMFRFFVRALDLVAGDEATSQEDAK